MIIIEKKGCPPPKYLNLFEKCIGVFVPIWILRIKDLSNGAKLTYGALLRHAGRKGYCWVSQGLLAEELGRSRDTINRWISELKRYGLIEVKSRGRGRSRMYRFLYKEGLIKNTDLRNGVVITDMINDLSQYTL